MRESVDVNTYVLKDGRKMIIRKATAEDAPVYLKYLKKVGSESDFLTFGGDEIMATVEDERNFIETSLCYNNRLFLMAEVEGSLAGNLNFNGGIRERTAHVGEFGITVLKEYWGLGIGTRLIETMICWAKGTGFIKKINLRVRSDNYRAIDMYTKFGFVREGILTRDFYMDDRFYDSIMMGLPIG